MATQVQIRGAAQATQEARTLAAREVDINTTDSRLCVHDGSTAGGMKHVNARDAQNNEFTYAAAAGTDTITATMAYAPTPGSGQAFLLKMAANCTGATTLNINGAGAKTVKKIVDGALSDTEEDDTVQDAMQWFADNGTYYVLINPGTGGTAGGVVGAQTAANDASLDFDSVFAAGNNYEIDLVNVVPATDGAGLLLRFTDDNGSSFETSGYVSEATSQRGATETPFTGDADRAVGAATSHQLGNVGSGSGEHGVSGTVRIYNPGGAFRKHYTFDLIYINNSAEKVVIKGAGSFDSGTALTGFQVKFNTGNVESGVVVCREKPNS